MVTINEVAVEAGVSPSTVSRVFSRPEVVNSVTRQRVMEVADRLGYTPNRIARSLAIGKSGNLGLIVPDIANPFFAHLIKAVQVEARQAGLALFIAETDEHRLDEYPLVKAMAKQVDGLVLASPRMSDSQIRELVEIAPIVLINRKLRGVQSVLIPSADGMRQAVDHLAALGHDGCVYLAGPRNSWTNLQRRSAIRGACRRHAMSYTEMGPFEPRFESGVRAADPLIAAGATAVIAYDDVIALGVISRLSEREVRVGREMSVIGVDDSPLAAIACPPLTTVRVPAAKAGAVAVRLLLDLLAGRDANGGLPTELPTDLIVRSTTAPAPAAR